MEAIHNYTVRRAVSVWFTSSLLVITSLVVFPLSATNSASAASGTGIIVPLYIYPGKAWDTLIGIKANNSDVRIVAVINPSSGPGAAKDPNYASGVQKLKNAGIIVIGYVWTNYGFKSTSASMAETTKYKNWYSLNGIFFDAMSNAKGKEWYYRGLNAHAESKGMTYTVGNPGADTRPSYIGTVDNIVIYENRNTPSLSYLGGWHANYDKQNFSFIGYGVNALDEPFARNATSYVGSMYITNDALPNPYDSLPAYLDDLAAVLSE